MKKRSFFQKLTGSYPFDEEAGFEDDDDLMDPEPIKKAGRSAQRRAVVHTQDEMPSEEEYSEEDVGQLAVDVFQTPDNIVIQAMVAGMHPSKLDVQIGREVVTIRGERKNTQEVVHDDYFFQELYWGLFSRTITLPEEVDPDMADASEKNGLLTIVLPKLNKERIQKVRVKSG